MKFAILGKGAYGEALGRILETNGHIVEYFDPYKGTAPLKKVLKGAEVMVLATPSEAVPEIVAELPKKLPLLVATKGLLSLDAFQKFKDVIIMSGPGFAKDVRAGDYTMWTTTDQRVDEWFKQDWLEFDHTNDEIGVVLCGALKNVYAIEAGLERLKPLSGKMNVFREQALWEMRRILEKNGGQWTTVFLACGIGDLTLTCSPGSRNYRYGMRLWQDHDYVPEETVEGVTTLRALRAGALKIPSEETPILNKILESDMIGHV